MLNADSGELIVEAERDTGPAFAGPASASDGPARTADGREITVLCNVASAAETRLGLAEGAAGLACLALIGQVAEVGRAAGIGVSVCGDSAADPLALPLLIGAGVRMLSVPTARVRRVRSWVARLEAETCAELTARALRAATVDEVRTLVPPL